MSVASRSLIILSALALVGSSDAALAKNWGTIVLTERSYGVTKVWPGQPVEIRLRTQAGTGYSWHPTSSASKVRELPTVQSSGMLPGGKQVQRFLFKSKRSGTYLVGFTYGQPWKGGAKGAKYRSFTIKVR